MREKVPHFIVNAWESGRSNGSFLATVLFTDLTGFTTMTQTLMNYGKEGAEILASLINSVFTPAIEAIYNHGGFITTFSGDAFTAVFPGKLKLSNQQALHAATAIHNFVDQNSFIDTKFGKFRIGIKTGIGSGKVQFRIFSTVGRKNYFFYGIGFDHCFSAVNRAKNGEVIVHTLNSNNDPVWIPYNLSKLTKLTGIAIQSKTSELPRIPSNSTTTWKLFVDSEVTTTHDLGEFRNIVSMFIEFRTKNCFFKGVEELALLCQKYGAHLNKLEYTDKGIVCLLFFGAPKALEQSEKKACLLAMEAQIRWKQSIKIGFSSGIVFTGLIGSVNRNEYSALGMVVNLSSRITSNTAWGTIQLPATVSEKIAHQFQFTESQVLHMKGIGESTQLTLLISQKQEAFSVQIDHYVRRPEEDQVSDLLEVVRSGKLFRLIQINGEAGIGKTALISEISNQHTDLNFSWLFCEDTESAAFAPFRTFITSFFTQNPRLTDVQKKRRFNKKFLQFLSTISTKLLHDELLRTRELLAELAGVSNKNFLLEQLDAKARQENIIQALVNFLLAMSTHEPFVLVIDDAHWIDFGSLKVLERLSLNATGFRIGVILLTRPASDGNPWSIPSTILQSSCMEQISLFAFNKKMLKEFLKKTFLTNTLPTETLEFFWNKCEGNPFFAEQLSLYAKEHKQIDDQFRLLSAGSGVPATISQIILSRIDELSSEIKQIITTASVLGREFSLEVLEAVLFQSSSYKREKLHFELKTILQERIWRIVSSLSYIFHHALIRETVYETQLKETLRRLHQITGEVLEDLYEQDNCRIVAQKSERKNQPYNNYVYQLAMHFDSAQDDIKAPKYLAQAANAALAEYSNYQALEFYMRLQIYQQKNAPSKDLAANYLASGRIQRILGNNLDASYFFIQALDIAETVNANDISSDCLIEQAMLKNEQGDSEAAHTLLNQAESFIKSQGRSKVLARIYNNRGNIYYYQGNYASALSCYQQKKEICNELQDEAGVAAASGNIGVVYKVQKKYSMALNCYKEYLESSRKCNDKKGQALALGNIGVVMTHLGQVDKAVKHQQKAYALYKLLGDKNGCNRCLCNIGFTYTESGQYSDAFACFEEARKIYKELGDLKGMSIAISNMGECCLHLGELDQAISHYEQEMAIAFKFNDQPTTADILIILAEIKSLQAFRQLIAKVSESITENESISMSTSELKTPKQSLVNRFSLDPELISQAMSYLQEALSIARELSDHNTQCHCYLRKAAISLERNDFSTAISYLSVCETLIQKADANCLFDLRLYRGLCSENVALLDELKNDSTLNKKQQARLFSALWYRLGHETDRKKALQLWSSLEKHKPDYLHRLALHSLELPWQTLSIFQSFSL